MKQLLKIYRHFMTDPLYRSSLYVMASTFILAGFGFIFWIFMARLFSAQNVGIATTLISLMNLISGFSTLGFTISLMRYLPTADKRNDIINFSFIVTGLSSFTAALIFLLIMYIFSPHFLPIQMNYVSIFLFAIFVVFSSWNVSIESIFMAYRASGNILLKNFLLSILKLILPFFFLYFGGYGIFLSFALATTLSTVLGLVFLVYRYKFVPRFVFNVAIFKKMLSFSLGNYLAGFLYQAPGLILPIIIAHFLTPKAAAYYYIASMILNFLIIIPIASSQALLTEGAYDSTVLRRHLIKSITIILEVLLPAIFVIFFFGNIILHFFGKNYEADAFGLLRLLCVSSLFMAIPLLGSSVMRVKHKTRKLILYNFIGAILVLTPMFLFISHGLTAVGMGWLIGQVLMSLLFLRYLWSEIK